MKAIAKKYWPDRHLKDDRNVNLASFISKLQEALEKQIEKAPELVLQRIVLDASKTPKRMPSGSSRSASQSASCQRYAKQVVGRS